MKWSPLAEKVHHLLIRKSLLKQNDRILLAVSGGRDSVALLSIMVELKEYWNWELLVCHIDHNLRPGEDEKEAALCRDLADKFDLKYLEKTVDLLSSSAKKKYKSKSSQNPSLESIAREARYEVFNEWANEYHCNAICSGHHMNDQAETVLYRMLTGAGLKGLQGIPASREIFVRPLLELRREELSQYIFKKKLSYFDDPSNKEQKFVRNKIRHAVIPALKGMGFDDPEQALASTAASMEEASLALEQISHEAYQRTVVSSAKSVKFRIKQYEELPVYVQKKILRNIFNLHFSITQHLSEKQLDQILAFIENGEQGASTDLFGVSILKDRECIVFPFESGEKLREKFICKPSKIQIDDIEIKIEMKIAKQNLYTKDQLIAYFSIDLLGKELEFRSWESGDQMSIFGAGMTKKVSDILKDEKVSTLEKQTYPVLIMGDKLIWIPGVKRSNDYILKNSDIEMLAITYKYGEKT